MERNDYVRHAILGEGVVVSVAPKKRGRPHYAKVIFPQTRHARHDVESRVLVRSLTLLTPSEALGIAQRDPGDDE